MILSPPNNCHIDWASHDAAKHACLNWHYSKSVPAGKLVKIGVWENDSFRGVVLFSRGATPHIASPYSMTQLEVCELTRVALRNHKTPVSRIMKIALRFLKTACPKMRLVVSYADLDQDHHGGIYQAGNWVYTGLNNAGSRGAFVVNGKKMHPRSVGAMGGTQSIEWVRANLDPNAAEHITAGKHKYLMPLDKQTAEYIAHLKQPYPKRSKQATAGTTGTAAGQHRPERSKSTAVLLDV